ncbi:hypothetical protein [Endozoicomonas sp.]|uniref:hypothetical protein n=1 Tax=Endozoicomonas sp. TaxID=1892382 RepID=UPI002884FDB5|nr:hypothetical protein [Endozoicomonas sp.]
MKNTLLAFGILLISFQVSARSVMNEHSIAAKAETHDKVQTTAFEENSSERAPLTLIPPAQQNLVDLQTLMEFLMLEENQTIASTLESIDLENKSIQFNRGCKAVFMREETRQSNCGHRHLLGPAGPLKLAYILCN